MTAPSKISALPTSEPEAVAEFAAAHPHPTDDAGDCDESWADSDSEWRWHCTLNVGHPGPHLAGTGANPEVWAAAW